MIINLYYDTPKRYVESSYLLHNKMNKRIYSSLEASDLIINVTDIFEKEINMGLIDALISWNIPIYFLVNKKDQLKVFRI